MHGRTALALAVSLFFAGIAEALPTQYVRARGNNRNDGLSPATAIRSIRVAARRLTDTGGRIIVGPGTYPERDISPRTSTKTTVRVEPLEFIADRDGTLTGDAPGPVLVDASGNPTGFLIYGEKGVRIDGFHVRGASDAGIQVRYNRGAEIASSDVTISNCVVFENEKRGIDVQDASDTVVLNNLVYANGSTGISVGGDAVGSKNALIAYSTVARNGAHGIFVGAGNQSEVVSPHALLVGNVVAGNGLGPVEGVPGIKVAPATVALVSTGFNVNADGFEGVGLADPTDLEVDPLFADASGASGEDGFRLRDASPAIDHGAVPLAEIGLGGSTRDDDSPDEGRADAGYHFGNTATAITVPPIPIYVRRTGDDGNDGGTPGSAFASVRHAVTKARFGHRVVVGGGVYCEGDVSLKGPSGQLRSGLPGRPIEIVADVDGAWTGDPGPVVLDAGGVLPECAGGGAASRFETGFNVLGSSHVVIDGFHILGAFDSGVQIRAQESASGLVGADDVTVCNSVVFSNRSGILVRDSARATIFNNLVYANATGGVAVGGWIAGSPDARVVNNTVYGNGATGILIGTRVFQEGTPSPGALVLNNLLDRNDRSLLVTPRSLQDFVGASNLDGTLVGSIGFIAPSGGDARLGGAAFADDDFRLRHVGAGQAVTSRAVDRGAAAAAAIGLAAGSTRTDGLPDQGMADVGFHYRSQAGDRTPVLGSFQPLQARVLQSRHDRVLFVHPDGEDGADGLSPATPMRSIAAAVRAAKRGDLVAVAPGRYPEGDVNLALPGTLQQPISIVADTTGRLTGSPPGPVVLDAAGQYDTGFILLQRSFAQVRGFHITGARQAGVQLRACPGDGTSCAATAGSDHVTVADNVLFSNRRGIDVVDSSDALLFNNLIYANDSTGVGVLGQLRAARDVQLINNTISRNRGDATIFSGPVGAPNGTLLNNVISRNQALGVRTNAVSASGLTLSHNLNRDGANGTTPPDPQSPAGEPAFVRPEGRDRRLGGQWFLDDDFRLSVARSAAIDAAGMSASDLALSAGVARSDGLPDRGEAADLGYHYPAPGPLAGIPEPVLTLYVRGQAGDDANDGLSPETALRSIARAAAQAGAGTTIIVGPGIYREGNLAPSGGGTLANPVVFQGDSRGRETGDLPGAVVVDASGFSTGFRIAGHSYVRVEGLHVTGAGFAGILAQNATGIELSDLRVFSNTGVGVAFVRPRGGNTLFNSLVYANGGDGVQVRLRRVRDSVVRVASTTVYRNGGRGIWLDHSPYERRQGVVLVANNIVQGHSQDLVVSPAEWKGLRLLPNLLSTAPTGILPTPPLAILAEVFEAAAGPDGVLGGAGFGDDDLRVAEPQGVVDTGSGSAALWGLDGHTVRRDGAPDTGNVDLGHHATA